MNYVEAFRSLKCSRDIFDIVKLNNKPAKEIIEAMSLIQRAKRILLHDDYTVVDLCAGNGILGVLLSFLFSRVTTVAIDEKRPQREWDKVRRFSYLEADLFGLEPSFIKDRTKQSIVLMSIHPCRELARKNIELFNEMDSAKWLFMMPCCAGKIDPSVIPDFLDERLGHYLSWVYQLFSEVESPHKKIYVDPDNQSPLNAIIVAGKSKIPA